MRLIDADALQYSDARDMLPTGQYITREEIDKAAEPIQQGHWILDKRGNWVCEFCGNAPYHSDMHNMNYCPNCGAKLTIERDNITTHLIWNEPTVDAEPTEEQVKEYCRKRCLVVLDSGLFNEMKARWSGETVKHGHWIFGQTMGHSWMKCSECCVSQGGQTATFTYCPNCGAKMDEVTE